MYIHHIVYLCKDVKKYIMKILRCSSYSFKRCKQLVVGDHIHHIILILEATHSDISLILLFLVKWTALATTFLSVQSNARNIYRRSEANLPSHHFNLECRYLGGVILSFLSLLRWFSLVDKLLAKINLPSLALR